MRIRKSHATLAQLAEQRFCKAKAIGSSPIGGTTPSTPEDALLKAAEYWAEEFMRLNQKHYELEIKVNQVKDLLFDEESEDP